MSEVHLKDLSKIYLDQIAESGVGYEPGKPATKLGAVTGIPKADQMSAAERIKKKTAEKKAALEKKHGKKMDDHPEYPKKKYVDEADMSGAPSIKDAKPATKTNVKYDPHMKVMAPQKEEFELDESDSLAAMQARREKRLAAQRKKMGTSSTGQDFGHDYGISSAERKKRQQAEFDKFVGRGKKTQKEALDPVGKEDGDVNNDGKKDSSDSYLMKRRAAIAKALGKKKQTEEVENPSKDLKSAVKKAVKRIDHNVSGDVDKNDKSMGNYGEFVPSADGKKKLTTKIGEGYSNWRTDLTEVMDDIESKPIKEKSVKNKVTINPKLSEAVEEIGGQVLEVTEVQEEASMSPQEIQLQKKKAMIDKMIATKRQQGLTKAKKSEEPAKAVGEEMSIKDQMRISREANAKRKPYQPGDHQKARAAILRNAANKAKKDTRTDAQKMTDATGPRDAFGRPAKSGYRGD